MDGYISQIALEAIKKYIKEAIIVRKDSATIARVAVLASSMSAHLAYADQTLSSMQGAVLSDKDMLECVYSMATRVKYSLASCGKSYYDLIDILTAIGWNESGNLEYSSHGVSQMQTLFDEAYAISDEEKRHKLVHYEWLSVLILINIYLLDIFEVIDGLSSYIAANSNQPNIG